MKITRVVAGAVLFAGLGLGIGPGAAQDTAGPPAEFPPESFTGQQYVDSTGCIYIRAGIDGAVTWVPRVNRQRQQICGQTPTFGVAEAPVETAQAVEATPAPIAVASVPKPVPVARPAPKPAAVVRPAPAPGPVAVAPAPRAEVRVVRGDAANGDVNGTTRIMPRHVYDARLNGGPRKVPAGYRQAWDDDRLNPRRAEQSLGGLARTRLKWTRTVPRRLIDTVTGADLTSQVALVYPYTDPEAQARALGKVTLVHRDGKVLKRIVRAKTRAPVLSSRSVSRAEAAAGRYVQAGVFAKERNAKAAMARLTQAGVPARLARVRKGARQMAMVVTGPFADGAALDQGLRATRAAGFRDAFVR